MSTSEEQKIMREGGKRLSRILKEVARAVRPGITGLELDALAYKLITEGGDEPSFLDYQPGGADVPFPNTLCVSRNNEIVHGIPNDIPFEEGDIVGIDLGLKHEGMHVDAAVTVGVGGISEEGKILISTTKKALDEAIRTLRAGVYIGDVSAAIEACAREKKLGIPAELGGHGVSYELHEPPYIPNVGKRGTGEELQAGMFLAIEPIFTTGKGGIRLGKDGSVYETRDGSLSAHFEHTVLVTEKGCEVLTQ